MHNSPDKSMVRFKARVIHVGNLMRVLSPPPRQRADFLDREFSLTEDTPKADHQLKPQPSVLMFVTEIPSQPISDSNLGIQMRDQGYYFRRPWGKLCITPVPAAERTSTHVLPQSQSTFWPSSVRSGPDLLQFHGRILPRPRHAQSL
jgi:hypothetical protein